MGRKAFSIHSDFYHELTSLEPGERGDILLALIAWASDQEIPPLPPATAMLFRLMRAQIERISRANSDNGKSGGRPSEESEESEAGQKKPSVTVTVTVPDTDTVPDTVTEKESAPTRHKHGQFGWVLLTDDEYNRLLNDLGPSEVKRCIAYVDESAQSNGNRNKWRDWNLVVRKCSRNKWGLGSRGGDQGGRKSFTELAEEMEAQL